MEKRYVQPLRKCFDTLSEAEGINYIILVADALENADEVNIVGGDGWNIEEGETSPDFFTMIGGIIENYLRETDLKYTDKLKILREFHTSLIDNITTKAEEEQ